MVVLSDLVARVTNCEEHRHILMTWFKTQRSYLTLQLPYITLSTTHHQTQRISCLPFSLTWIHKHPLFLTFNVDLCEDNCVSHRAAVRFKLPVICLHLCYCSKHSRIFTLRHTCSWLLMKSVFLFLESLLMPLQFKTDIDGKMLLNLMCYLICCMFCYFFVCLFFYFVIFCL